MEEKRKYNTGETEETLKKEYNYEGSTLRNGQLIMLDMVKFLHDICKDNNIEYSIDGGNVLGAVRHKGFIPWDDDFDIALFRKDYKKLHKLLRATNHPRYIVQDQHTDPNYPLFYYKLRDTKSHHISKENCRDNMKFDGFLVDCFPIIRGPIRPLQKFCFKLHFFLYSRFRFKYPKLFWTGFYFMKHVLFPLFRFCSFVFGDKSKVGDDYEVGFTPKWDYDSYYPFKEVEYEGCMLMGPKDIVEYSKHLYGNNYMELPPKSERNHHGIDKYIIEQIV